LSRSGDSQVKPSPPFSQSTPSFSAIFSSPTFHLSDLMNWITQTRQSRASARMTTPKAAVDLPLPSPVLTSTSERGRTLGGATVAVLQGLLIFAATLVAGFRPVSLLAIPAAFLVIALIAIVFAALATAIGSTLKEMQGFQMVMNFFVMPLWFLSGALYPLQGLPPALAVLTRVDPLTYGVDGVRGIMLGASHFGIAVDVGVLLAVGVLFVAAGAWRFSKIEV